MTALAETSPKTGDRVDGPRSWIVAFACLGAATVSMGVAYTSGVYFVVFVEEFRESRGKTALIASMNYAVLCIVGPLTSIISHRWSHRTSTVLGGIVTSVGLLLSAFSTSVNDLIISFGVITGAGLGFVYTPTVTVVAEHFDRWRGLAIGIATCGSGLGTFVYPFIIEAMTEIYGWRGSLIILSGLSLHICVFGALQFPVEASHIVATQGNFGSKVGFTECEPNKKEIYSSEYKRMIALFSIPKFIILCISCTLISFGLSVFSTHMPAFAVRNVYLSATEMASLLSVTGITNMVSRLLIGGLLAIPRVDPQVLYMLCYTVMGIDIACIPLAYNYSGMIATSLVFGASFACYGPVLCSLAIKYVGMELYTASHGYINIFCGVGIILGAPSAGWLFDALQTYPPSFYLGGVSVVLSAVIILFPWFFTRGKPSKLEEEYSKGFPESEIATAGDKLIVVEVVV